MLGLREKLGLFANLRPAKLYSDLADASTLKREVIDGIDVLVVRELTGGGVHYSFEAIGLKVTAEQAFRMVRRGGTATVIGMIPPGEMVSLHGPVSTYLPKQPFRTVFLDWDVGAIPEDAAESEIEGHYLEIYREITARIRDLMETLRGEEAD